MTTSHPCLNFQITETANLFQFVSDLALWHHSSRQKNREIWLKKTGPLTTEETKILRLATQIFKKYTFGSNYWGKVFLLESDEKVWDIAKNQFSSGDYATFKEIAQGFCPRFKTIWETNKPLLEQWKNQLATTTSKWSPSGLMQDLDILFNKHVSRSDIQIKIVLLLNTQNNTPSGGANLGYGIITAEISQVLPQYIRPTWSLIWHELIHNPWQKSQQYQDLLDEVSKILENKKIVPLLSWQQLRDFINETITSALFPKGYLAKKYFHFPLDEYFSDLSKQIFKSDSCSLPNQVWHLWEVFSGIKFTPKIEKYIQDKKPLDRDFLLPLKDLLEEFRSKFHLKKTIS